MPSMMAKNSGRARYLLVTTRSMASLRARSRDSRHFTTVPEQTVSMKVVAHIRQGGVAVHAALVLHLLDAVLNELQLVLVQGQAGHGCPRLPQ